jgi:hypothetical protein
VRSIRVQVNVNINIAVSMFIVERWTFDAHRSLCLARLITQEAITI